MPLLMLDEFKKSSRNLWSAEGLETDVMVHLLIFDSGFPHKFHLCDGECKQHIL